ncbi:alpha-ribazole phosphatase [Aquimarina hainanensis]|uniref:Alpha-ribazole phosphatase n=1 Tax=Aquimarina hainanensis TaxID=1578017 RepID=A0ABW5NAX2_9FLAO|nr:alpha-ribazole phosphatase [Aquimarina sp. TRL1]QKX06278.1 alpha-ribazole phosphatase [Aquimarina sp. TRL1]
MEIYVIRHTTPDIAKGICYGQSDIGVVDTFDQEKENIHRQLPLSEITTVYSSPLLRCKLLAETFQKPVVYDERLKELNFGDWELQSWDAIDQKELKPWMDDFVTTPVPNGESYIALQKRVVSFYQSLPHSSSQKIIIVSHAGSLRALLSYLQNISLKDSFNIKIAYGDVIQL